MSPIIRETDGLAMSSRNAYLTEEERKTAPFFYELLKRSAEEYQENIEINEIIKKFNERAQKKGFIVDYIEFVNKETLAPIQDEKESVVLAAAVYLNNTRLIDNIIIPS